MLVPKAVMVSSLPTPKMRSWMSAKVRRPDSSLMFKLNRCMTQSEYSFKFLGVKDLKFCWVGLGFLETKAHVILREIAIE